LACKSSLLPYIIWFINLGGKSNKLKTIKKHFLASKKSSLKLLVMST